MKHNQYPIRRSIAAIAAIGSLGAIEACSADDQARPQPTATITVTAQPNPSESAPTLTAAQIALEKTAKTTAKRVLHDLADPRSLASNPSLFFLSNKQAFLTQNALSLTHPYVSASYKEADQTLTIHNENVVNPDAPESKVRFNFVELDYKMPDGLNQADRKLAAGQQLTVNDMQALLNVAGVELTYAEVDNARGHSFQALNYDKKGRLHYGEAMKYQGPYHAPTADQLARLGDNMVLTEIALHTSLESE